MIPQIHIDKNKYALKPSPPTIIDANSSTSTSYVTNLTTSGGNLQCYNTQPF